MRVEYEERSWQAARGWTVLPKTLKIELCLTPS